MFSFDKKSGRYGASKMTFRSEQVRFILYDSTAQKNGAELFSVVTVPSTDWQHKPKDGYTVIFQTSTLTYAARITEAGKNIENHRRIYQGAFQRNRITGGKNEKSSYSRR